MKPKKKSPLPDFHPVDILLKTSVQGDRKILKILAEVDMSIRRKPEAGLVMMTINDGTGTDFHLGEVLVTEAEVEYEGRVGYAMVLGNNPEKALARAGVSVIMESLDSAHKTKLVDTLLREAKKINQKERADRALLSSTKVKFESMNQW